MPRVFPKKQLPEHHIVSLTASTSENQLGGFGSQQFRKTVTGFFQQVPGPSAGVVGAGWIAVFLPKQLL